MRSFFAAALCFALPLDAFAQDSDHCVPYMESRQISQPPAELSDEAAIEIVGKALLPITFDTSLLSGDIRVHDRDMPRGPCSPQQLAMLVADLNAIASATEVSDPQALSGTWLSDDILATDAGFVVPGQEVLVIEPSTGADSDDGPADTIAVKQYWYRAITPNGGSLWNAEGDYAGLVAQGVLHPTDEGEFMQDSLLAPFNYTNEELHPERSDDLFIKAKLNIFDRAVSFATDGDSLVLRYKAKMPVFRFESDATRTYTRVADEAPEIALRFIMTAEVSQAKYLNCLARKISTQDPALIEFLKPFSLDEVKDLTRQAVLLSSERDAVMQELRAGSQSKELLDRLLPLMDQTDTINEQLDPLIANLSSPEGTALCPEPPRMF